MLLKGQFIMTSISQWKHLIPTFTARKMLTQAICSRVNLSWWASVGGSAWYLHSQQGRCSLEQFAQGIMVSLVCTGDGVQGSVRWAWLNMLSGWKQSTCLGSRVGWPWSMPFGGGLMLAFMWHYIQSDENSLHLERAWNLHIVRTLVGPLCNLVQWFVSDWRQSAFAISLQPEGLGPGSGLQLSCVHSPQGHKFLPLDFEMSWNELMQQAQLNMLNYFTAGARGWGFSSETGAS